MAALPEGLVFLVADDDELARMVAESIIHAAKGDPDHSVVLGRTYNEVQSIPQLTMELAAKFGSGKMIVILDQFMDRFDEGTIKGSDLAKVLRAGGFDGVVIIQSGDNDMCAELQYIAAGADGSICKGDGLTESLAEIAQLWHSRVS